MYEVKDTFINLGKRMPGLLYEPVGMDDKTLNTILVMHSNEDYLTFPIGKQMAQRGFRVLCANVMNMEGFFFTQIEKMQAVKNAIEFLRNKKNIGKIILMGHSGGATLMTAYQAIAENGAKIFQNENVIYPYPDNDVLPPADGIMLLDANWGNAAMQLFSLDPAVEDETTGKIRNPEYDLFLKENGFDENGSLFSEEFVKKFQKKQSDRNQKILEYALKRLEKIENGEGMYEDDEPFVVPGADQVFFNNKLYAQDIRLMARTKNEHKLIHGDGSITTEIVRSVRGPENPRCLTGKLRDGAHIMTIRTYLSSYAVRTNDEYGYNDREVYGIDWKSSYSCPPGNVTYIHVPLLVMGMTAGWEYLASETIYDMAASKDKDIAFVEGATHIFRPDISKEKYEGQFGDTECNLYNYVADWINKDNRF